MTSIYFKGCLKGVKIYQTVQVRENERRKFISYSSICNCKDVFETINPMDAIVYKNVHSPFGRSYIIYCIVNIFEERSNLEIKVKFITNIPILKILESLVTSARAKKSPLQVQLQVTVSRSKAKLIKSGSNDAKFLPHLIH